VRPFRGGESATSSGNAWRLLHGRAQRVREAASGGRAKVWLDIARKRSSFRKRSSRIGKCRLLCLPAHSADKARQQEGLSFGGTGDYTSEREVLRAEEQDGLLLLLLLLLFSK